MFLSIVLEIKSDFEKFLAPFWWQRCKIRKVFLLVIRISFISSFADPRGLSKIRTASEERKTKRSAPPTPTAASAASTALTNVASTASEQKQQDFCPSCGEAFDCGKKRRLIDSCGHERCYTCMFSKELCSLCTYEGE